jgi:hypothetical protein
MTWVKQGLIYSPKLQNSENTHLQVPTVLVKDDRLRVYYAGRYKNGRSYTAYFDLDINNFKKILHFNNAEILAQGKPGTFDDEGIMPSEVINHDQKIYLYYSGWNKRVSIPYHNATGLAVSEDGGHSFNRVFDGPILDRIATEPYLAVTPCILKEGKLWHMWYISGLRWVNVNDHYEPVYAIKYASSSDGINWKRENDICIPQYHEFEAFSRPSVIKKDGKYCMWYCYRDSHDYRDGKGSYRMGYSESEDALKWTRMDHKSGIALSDNPDDWDSKMLCYPYITKVKNQLYLFYNGNGFGQSGLGYAKWVN